MTGRSLSLPPLARIALPAAILVALALASAAATLFIIRPADGPAPPPPYISGQSANFLNRAQAMTHLRGYLATTLWAETAYVAALQQDPSLQRALQAPIPLQCAQPAAAPTTEQTRYLECARRSAASAPHTTPWPSMSENARVQAANRMLSNLWRATNPVERVRLTVLWSEGVDPTDAASIQELQQQYDHCPEAMMSQRSRLVAAKSPQQLARAWLLIADQVEDCADRTSTRLFKAATPTEP